MENNHDIIIIGGGLGGLLCGAILSKNGYNIAIIEQNNKVGGCLDSYARDGALFETGVHYVGGLDKGQNLYQIFKYVGIINSLKLERLDLDNFDTIVFENNPKRYSFAQSYDRFIDTLAKDFPKEREGIKKYCDKIKDICIRFPLYNLKNGSFMDKLDLLNISAIETINSCVTDPILCNVLAGNNGLYAGVAEKTPFYIHALILNSYIESAWRTIGGGIQIARGLTKIIENNGGTIITKTKVEKIITQNGIASKVITTDNREFSGKYFISDLHPATTISMTETDVFRKAYIHRINSLENTIGSFTLNVAFKENTFPHMNYNLYCFTQNNVWSGINYNNSDWPVSYVYFSSSLNQKTAHSASILVMTKYSEFEKWHNTFNTIYKPGDRGSGYEEFKQEKAERLINLVEKTLPGFKKSIDKYHTLTPLTYRDYIGSPDGSLYGVLRDYREPLKTFIPARTKIPNLFLTGQNLNIHGVLGVSVSSLITCGELLGIESLLEQINKS